MLAMCGSSTAYLRGANVSGDTIAERDGHLTDLSTAPWGVLLLRLVPAGLFFAHAGLKRPI